MKCLLNNPGRLPLTNAEGLRANTCNVVSWSSSLAVAKLGLASSISKAIPALFFFNIYIYIYIYFFEAKKENLKKEHLRSIWIQLKLKTEKHYSKIIFKYVNSAVSPIFNEKVVEKCSLWDSWIVYGSTVHGRKVKKLRLGKKSHTMVGVRNFCLGNLISLNQLVIYYEKSHL